MVFTAAAPRHELVDRTDLAETKTPPRNGLATTSMLANVNGSDDLADRVRADLPARASRTTPLTEQRLRRHDHRASRSTAGRSNVRL